MSRRFVAIAVAAIGLSACGSPFKRVREVRSFEIPGERFQTMALIAGSTSQPNLQMAAGVRELLANEGWTVEQPGGLWTSQVAALESLCSQGEESRFDGVIFLYWDRITLRDCETQTAAFDLQGGFMGVDEMTRRLIRYLQGKPPP